MARDLRTALEARRGEVERDRAVAGGHWVAEGIIELLGTGETTVDVKFPVKFVERPLVFGGGGAVDNQRIVTGEFPIWQVGVLRWNRTTRPDVPDSPMYIGATLVIVVTGAVDDEATFQSEAWWMARGRALTNPTVGGL